MHRGDLEQGPKGDLWSILFDLIDERSGVTDVIKVKSHLEDEGPSVITQNKTRSAFTTCLQTLWQIVAEEAAKRLLPDLNLEREAKKAERVGIGVAKRLARVQADIWAKRGAAGDIYELEPLVTRTRSAIGKLVDELAQQGHLGFEMQSLQRVPRQQTIQFLEPNSLYPEAMCGRSHIPIQKKDSTT